MKLWLLCLLLFFSRFAAGQHVIDSVDRPKLNATSLSGRFIKKLLVSKEDSSIYLIGDIRRDHRIFGYKMPNINSEKLPL